MGKSIFQKRGNKFLKGKNAELYSFCFSTLLNINPWTILQTNNRATLYRFAFRIEN